MEVGRSVFWLRIWLGKVVSDISSDAAPRDKADDSVQRDFRCRRVWMVRVKSLRCSNFVDVTD